MRSAFIIAFSLCLASTAAADERPKIHWEPGWTHVGTADYALATLGTGMTLVQAIVLLNHKPPLRWDGPILFDEDARNVFRIRDQSGRDASTYIGWTLLLAQMGYPVFVDVPIAWTRYGRQVAWDIIWQNAVTQTIASAVDFGVRDLAGRARPTSWECTSRGGADCFLTPETTRSFPGGHTVTGTAASVLTCTQHLYLRLYGGPWDGITCAATLTSNMALAVMRVASDSHWVTDEIAGLAIGAAIGWGVPWLMHFRRSSSRSNASTPSAVVVIPTPLPAPRGMAFGAVGIF